ncbi:SpoIIE family protein phosphatase [Streptomyces sp. DSM 42041]|uniref:SpoIIE family protein phosphatase n=1 Tax=Streptomyces hazeniae TaxID=3075538 RepID=A0ABU2NQM1_9ACTN|nr:SpoIIE family protein phosphatase [Streptomyces sp. DSM 42041]MDT0379269.1 SpoIIE family protein phosphatase [Streptomyces sp. DSM 42041]
MGGPVNGRRAEPSPTVEVRIDHYSAVHLAASRAREIAVRCGLTGPLPDQAGAVASELASNLDKHAVDGVVYLQPVPGVPGLEILAADRGPGMAELARCLSDGYTTTGTLGTGLGAVQRISGGFLVRTEPGEGTVAAARITPPDTSPAARRTGMVRLPAEGEEFCGDGCAVAGETGAPTALVVDGLGHGEPAALAAHTALRAFEGLADRTLPEIVQGLHRSLRHTRGAAVGLLRLHEGRAEYCGVGNIRLCVLSPREEHRRMDGRPGVVGWNLPTPQVRSVPLRTGQVAVLYSDGIASRWSHAPSPFLLRLPPELLPAALAHRHRKYRDDATALSMEGL